MFFVIVFCSLFFASVRWLRRKERWSERWFQIDLSCVELDIKLCSSVLLVWMLQLMQEEATEARNSDMEPTDADQQTASAAVTDAGAEAPSSSTVAPSSSLSNDEIANGYRWVSNRSFPASSRCYLVSLLLLSNFVVLRILLCKVIDYLKLVYCVFGWC